MLKKDKASLCPTCGAKTVEYKHTMSVALVEGLTRLSKKQVANLKDLRLTRNQWDNFQKLRYWGLVEKFVDPKDQKRKGGVWKVTTCGNNFLKGKLAVQKTVITYRGETKNYEGILITAPDVIDGYKYRPEYAEEAVPAGHELG